MNDFVDWLRTNVSWLTSGFKDAVTNYLINPLQTIFTESPWWLVMAVVAGLTLLASGMRKAVVAVACLVVIFLIGLWQHSMETLVQVLIATIVTFVLGLALGILSARSDGFARVLRPGLDAAQTMPSFVYIVPAFVLFDVGRFTAIVAAIVFSVPPVIRLVDIGLRGVPPAIQEASLSYGASSLQRLVKVDLPVARPALQLALNQAVILVLSMVVVGGLTGGQALGLRCRHRVLAGDAVRRRAGGRRRAGPARHHARPDDRGSVRPAGLCRLLNQQPTSARAPRATSSRFLAT